MRSYLKPSENDLVLILILMIQPDHELCTNSAIVTYVLLSPELVNIFKNNCHINFYKIGIMRSQAFCEMGLIKHNLIAVPL